MLVRAISIPRIIRLLVSNIKNTEIDQIENIVKNEVDKPLTDI